MTKPETRRVQVVAVPHQLQGSGFRGYVEDESFSEWLEGLIRNDGVDFVFEEASGRGPSIAENLTNDALGHGHYLDFDPSRDERPKHGLAKDSGGGGPIDPMNSTDVYEWSDVEQQRKREELWQKRIQEQSFEKGLVICGTAHALSVAFRLKATGAEVEVYTYTPHGKLCPGQHREQNEIRCQVSSTHDEINFEMVVPDNVFRETMRKPTTCTFSTRGGDTRRGGLLFD